MAGGGACFGRGIVVVVFRVVRAYVLLCDVSGLAVVHAIDDVLLIFGAATGARVVSRVVGEAGGASIDIELWESLSTSRNSGMLGYRRRVIDLSRKLS